MSNPPDNRTVRVFLSSTFRDFAEERDLLVRKVFPELRRKCRERQVELVDVDLRWGITEKEAQQGKVLPICLAEIDRSRPYFMGFIGERYGWVPKAEQYDRSLLLEQPWLEEKKHLGNKSVTELEILHGVLENPAMEKRAFFYFRDPKYAKRKGGDYLSATVEEQEKLAALKQRIRESGFPVVENYKNPKSLAEKIGEDLWKLIDEVYPIDEVPDALTQERMIHEAYANTRRRLYLGGEGYITKLNEAMKAKPFRSVLIRGQSGGGKSSLLANWIASWSKRHKKAAVIVHHLGAGSDAADPIRLAVRLMQEISRITGDVFKPEGDPDKQLEKLPEWLAMASAWAQRCKTELLIVLDGLDKMSERQHLCWFPAFLPPRVKLITSCLDGNILEAAQGRLNWKELKVKPFTRIEQKRFIGEYLGRYRKSLTAKQCKVLQSHPLSGNPLFLLTVLEELRVFGVHEQLEHRLNELLSLPPSKLQGEAPTVDDVFEHVLSRLEKDIGKKSVQLAMESIWASRSGLLQDELLAIAKLTPAKWATIQNALDDSLYESSGKINFGQDYLRKAVQDRYELIGKKKMNLHRRMAEWFDKRTVDTRIAEELPWQWRESGKVTRLKRCLTNWQVFEILCKIDAYEILGYWLPLEGELEIEYRKAWMRLDFRKTEQIITKTQLLDVFLQIAGKYGELREYIVRSCLATLQGYYGARHSETLRATHRLAKVLYEIGGKEGEAELLLKQALEGLEASIGDRNPLTLTVMGNYCAILINKHDITIGAKRLLDHCDTTEVLLRKAIDLSTQVYGENHPDTLNKISMLGSLFLLRGDDGMAESLFRHVMNGFNSHVGIDYSSTQAMVSRLGDFLTRKKRYEDAKMLYKIVLGEIEIVYGFVHPKTLDMVYRLGVLLSEKGDYSEADLMLQRALHGREKALGLEHPRTLKSLIALAEFILLGAGETSNLSDIINLQKKSIRKANLDQVATLYRRAIEGRKKSLGEDHADTIAAIDRLAKILINAKNYKDSLPLLRESLCIKEIKFGTDQVTTYMTLMYLIIAMDKQSLRREAIEILHRHSSVSKTWGSIYRYQIARLECLEGNLDKAKILMMDEIRLDPKKKNQAIMDKDFLMIREYLESH